MKVATYNINGIKARLPVLLDWLREAAPDVAVLQEIKCEDDAFPREAFEDVGYRVAVHGQKSFNGVAMLSKLPIEDVCTGLPALDAPDTEGGNTGNGTGDDQARWIEATVCGDSAALRICGLYLPNGNPAPGPKYDYKLAWMARLEAHAQALLATEEPVVMAGDYNIIPEPRDVKRPDDWIEDALFRPESRAAFRRIVNLGFHDAVRESVTEDEAFTFWDYQRGAWERNDGIRIDHLLLSPQAADRLTGAGIDSEMRGRDKPSDHVPVWIEIEV